MWRLFLNLIFQGVDFDVLVHPVRVMLRSLCAYTAEVALVEEALTSLLMDSRIFWMHGAPHFRTYPRLGLYSRINLRQWPHERMYPTKAT